jgi:hypothetical protein
MNTFDFAGKTILITGASMGLGEAFARELSRRGATVILVARSEARLEALAGELGRAHVIAADLAVSGAPQRVFEAVRAAGLEVDVLVNNAGFGLFGVFDALPLEAQREEIDLNVRALVELTYLFLPELERRRGGVIQVASVAAYQPTPYMAVYGATKAFVLSFGEALWAEYRSRGVRVLTLSPGQTDTAFFARAGEGIPAQTRARPEDVVRRGLAAFVAGRASVIHGAGNNVLTFTSRFLGRELIATLMGRLSRPKESAALPRVSGQR